MTPQDRETNLRLIAAAAEKLEQTMGVPAELTVGQCIIESKWLGNAPGNNCFGIKAPKGATDYQLLETDEHLTPKQLADLRAEGVEILSAQEIPGSGKLRVRAKLKFMKFASIDDCFVAYGHLLVGGKYFRDRFARYRNHKDVNKLLADMSGADGQLPYFTGLGYVDLWKQITKQDNVREAIQEARA